LGDRWYGAYKNGKVALDVKGIWDAPKLIDFAVLDRRINDILEVAPDALIFPSPTSRIRACKNSKWLQMNASALKVCTTDPVILLGLERP
jgi:hypothetical protein